LVFIPQKKKPMPLTVRQHRLYMGTLPVLFNSKVRLKHDWAHAARQVELGAQLGSR
jgi:hypothetical protein